MFHYNEVQSDGHTWWQHARLNAGIILAAMLVLVFAVSAGGNITDALIRFVIHH